jgi:hypothetical protein
MEVSPHDHPIVPPVVPLARVDRHNIRNWSPRSELEVVGANWVHPLLGPAQDVEYSEKGNLWTHNNKHLTEVDENRHQNKGER